MLTKIFLLNKCQTSDQNSTAIIEQLRTVSKLRILSPMRKKGHVLKITQNDWENINKALTSYYTMTPWK